MKTRGFRYCKRCGAKLRKNGTQQNSKQRWRCVRCGTARIHRRRDTTFRNELKGFVSYILGMTARNKRKDSLATQSRHYAPYWQVVPVPCVTGEVHAFVVADATSVGMGVVGILRSETHVMTWHHGIRENSELWLRTFSTIPRPSAVVCDGQKGILKALKLLCPDVVIQRCLVHVERNMHTKLTRHPKSEAGQDLRQLVDQLFLVRTENDMAEFVALFLALYDRHETFLKQRTMNVDPTSSRKWWYTHRSVRSAYRQIDQLIRDDQLFAFITHPELHMPRDSNGLEGGVNSPLKELLHRHRGLTATHQQRLADWYLDSRTEYPYMKRGHEKPVKKHTF